MLRTIFIFAFSVVCTLMGQAQDMHRYIYWFDGNLADSIGATTTGGNVSIAADVSALTPGLHTVNVTTVSNGVAGPVYSRYFINGVNENSDMTMRYWFDGRYDEGVDVTGMSLATAVDVSALTPGLHTVNVTTVSNGVAGPVYSSYFVKGVNENSDVTMRYWFDGRYDEGVDVTGMSLATAVDVSALTPGLHTVNVTTVSNGVAGPVYSSYFLKGFIYDDQPVTVSVTIDGKDATTETHTLNPGSNIIQLDVNDLRVGLHTLVMRTYTTDHNFGPIYTSLFMRVPTDLETGAATLHYWFDEEESTETAELSGEGEIYQTTVDVSALTSGEHTVNGYLVWSNGSISGTYSSPFIISELEECATPELTYDEGKVIITCASEGAEIHYTLDGTEPNAEAELYEGPIEITRNCTVTAIAYCEFMIQSQTATLVIDNIHAATPSFSLDGEVLTIESATPGATIRYTLDGTDPTEESTVYTSPLTLTDNRTVKARAYAEDMNPSETASFEHSTFQTPTPELTYEDGKVTIACATEGTEIRYTLDGTEPNAESQLYNGAIEITRNCTVAAIAYCEDMLPSEVATLVVDDIHAATPSFSLDSDVLTIESATPGATIRYTLDGTDPTEESTVYTAPLTLTDNRTVKARAYADGMHPSEVASYEHSTIRAAKPVISYDGQYVQISAVATEDVIRYTTDGTEPTAQSEVYDGEFDAKGIITVKAIASREYFEDSDVAEYSTPVYYDGTTATVAQAGALSQAFGRIPAQSVESLNVTGEIDNTDMACLRTMGALRRLDLSEASIGALADEALANTGIVYARMPEHIGSVGSRLFAGSRSLCAIDWTASTPMSDDALGGVDNPNVLLYVTANGIAPASHINTVVNGYAQTIELTDGIDNCFWCPTPFDVHRISYAHSYGMVTAIGGASSGWETLTLPFDVQKVSHETAGEIAPFAAIDDGDYSARKPFWLMTLGATGFVRSTHVSANTPYLISMPNNNEYDSSHCLAGNVTFSSADIRVPATEANVLDNGTYTMVPVMQRVAAKPGIFALNITGWESGMDAGSAFVSGLRDIAPFEAYIYVTAGGSVYYLPLREMMGATENGIDDVLMGDDSLRLYTRGSVLYIVTGRARDTRIYNLQGMEVRAVTLEAGINAIEGLQPGYYIINGRKVRL